MNYVHLVKFNHERPSSDSVCKSTCSNVNIQLPNTKAYNQNNATHHLHQALSVMKLTNTAGEWVGFDRDCWTPCWSTQYWDPSHQQCSGLAWPWSNAGWLSSCAPEQCILQVSSPHDERHVGHKQFQGSRRPLVFPWTQTLAAFIGGGHWIIVPNWELFTYIVCPWFPLAICHINLFEKTMGCVVVCSQNWPSLCQMISQCFLGLWRVNDAAEVRVIGY